MEYAKVYHGKTITIKTMYKHRNLTPCKAIANLCKFLIEMLDGKHKYAIYSFGKNQTSRTNA